MKRGGALLALLLCGLGSVRTAQAASRDLEFRLLYRVPAGCPAADAFLARLNEHVAYGGSNYLEGTIVVTRAVAGGFQLSMRFNDGRWEEVEGDSCQQLVERAVRTAGMARTERPAERAEAELRRAIELAPDPRRWEQAAPSGSMASAAAVETRAAETPVTETPAALAAGVPSRGEPRTPPDTVASGDARQQRRGAWRASLLAQAQGINGALPGFAVGPGMALALGYGGWEARLEAAGWFAQSWASLPEPRRAEAWLRQGRLALAVCELSEEELGLGSVLFTICGRGAVVRLEALGSSTYSPGFTVYGTWGLRFGLGWEYAGLRVELQAGGDGALGATALAFPGGGNRFVAQTSQLAASLSVGWQFWSSSREPAKPRTSASGSRGKDVASAD